VDPSQLGPFFIGVPVFGGIAGLMYALVNSVLKVQERAGQQNAEWRSIVDEKDKQILRLETILALRDERIVKLEGRVAELERMQHG
jgi:hypothetical protein